MIFGGMVGEGIKEQARKSKPLRTLVGAIRRAHGLAAMRLGAIGSEQPLSQNWGHDRGTPIDRFYIEAFLEGHRADVQGHVLEVQEDDYSRRFGGDRVTHQDILNIDTSKPRATIIGDLADPATLPETQFDCILLTQTLHLVFDMQAAMENLHRALRPGGVLLITVPGITPLDPIEFLDSWYWSLTEPALRKVVCGPFQHEGASFETHGNLYAATALLHAAAVEEVSQAKLRKVDRRYPVTVAARVVK